MIPVIHSGVCSVVCAVQIRNAMAVASSLGRTLVMPQLWCGMDRWWAPHDGNIPGSSLALPFPCPMDHILDLEMYAAAICIRHSPGIEVEISTFACKHCKACNV